LKKIKDISIAMKLYFIVGAMAVLIILELGSLWFAIHTLSSVRALVGAEGLWSKAQKDAVYHLRKYYLTRSEDDYREFQKFMQVPLGDHTARLELLKKDPDLDIAKKGFLQGRVHPDDIDGIMKLLRRFHENHYISSAISIWTKGDSIILRIIPLAEKLHSELNSPHPAHGQLEAYMAAIDQTNQELTVLEDDFSYTLGDGSRWLENLILAILISVAITVEFTGLFLTILVTRGISRELNEINKATSKITKGDLTARATVLSKNEIGQVAHEVNQMTEQLIRSNKELEQVAIIASHDLQEPLRTISNFIELFQKQYKNQLDETSSEYLDHINGASNRMRLLVSDMLDYSRIGNDKTMMKLDCNKEVQYVLEDMALTIGETGARIDVSALPVIDGYFEIKLLFQNLISNAIKFCKQDCSPHVSISSVSRDNEWLFMVKDNGIGIEERYHKRVFTIFHRLHKENGFPGTGIGLAHCKKIIELHRGEIWIESELEKGSTFYFTIPRLNSCA